MDKKQAPKLGKLWKEWSKTTDGQHLIRTWLPGLLSSAMERLKPVVGSGTTITTVKKKEIMRPILKELDKLEPEVSKANFLNRSARRKLLVLCKKIRNV